MPTKFQANDRVMDNYGNTGTIAFTYAAGSPTEDSLYELILDNESLALRFDFELVRAS